MNTKDLQSLYIQSPKLNQLNILREVSVNAHITQAELATRCALSVAMVNNYMKELGNNGLLEYKRKSIKSVSYHLTPSGIRHLEMLQTEMIGEMAEMFARAKEQIRTHIVNQAHSALQGVVLYGMGHLTQLAFHAIESDGIHVQGVCDDNPAAIGSNFCGLEVMNISQIRFISPDAVIITKDHPPDEILLELIALSQHGIEIIYLGNFANGKPGDNFSLDSKLTASSDTNTKPFEASNF
jgi:predicted transcriptional regulator